MKISVWSRYAAVLSAVAGLGLSTGCEWTGGGGVEQWNSDYDFLNFSGVYRGLNAGLLITDYSSEVTTQPTSGLPGSTNNVAGETLAHGNGTSTVFSGNVDHIPVVPGSLLINAGAYSFSDAGGDGTLTANGGADGLFNYTTGAYTLNFHAALDDGAPINADYVYVIPGEVGTTSSGTGSGPNGNATSGASTFPIYSFTVEQAGNILRITDNNGALYEGNLGDIRSAGGASQNNVQSNGGVVTPSPGDEFIAQFTADGTSKAGFNVHMVGTFQAVVLSTATTGGGSSGTSVTITSVNLDQRHMLGTWIEDGGRTGNITGESSPVTVNPTTGAAATTP